MRGENASPEAQAKQLIADAAIEAQTVLATASQRRRSISTAIVLGPDGTPLFTIVSTWWSRMIIFGYGVMLLIIILMALILYVNTTKLDTLEEKVEEVKPTN